MDKLCIPPNTKVPNLVDNINRRNRIKNTWCRSLWLIILPNFNSYTQINKVLVIVFVMTQGSTCSFTSKFLHKALYYFFCVTLNSNKLFNCPKRNMKLLFLGGLGRKHKSQCNIFLKKLCVYCPSFHLSKLKKVHTKRCN